MMRRAVVLGVLTGWCGSASMVGGGCRTAVCQRDIAEYCGTACPTLDETLSFVRDGGWTEGDVTVRSCGGLVGVLYEEGYPHHRSEYYDEDSGELVGVKQVGGDRSGCGGRSTYQQFGRPSALCLFGCTLEVICATPYCDDTIDESEQCGSDSGGLR